MHSKKKKKSKYNTSSWKTIEQIRWYFKNVLFYQSNVFFFFLLLLEYILCLHVVGLWFCNIKIIDFSGLHAVWLK